jgi:hypothetical protein
MGGVASAGNVPHRPCTSVNYNQVKEVFARVLEEMADCETTETMFEPYANLALYALSNRKVKAQLTSA